MTPTSNIDLERMNKSQITKHLNTLTATFIFFTATLNLFLICIFSTMTILANMNTRGLGSQGYRKNALKLFQRNRWDIIFLQETYWFVDIEIEIRQQQS